MRGKIISDWGKVDFKNPEHIKKFGGAMQHFMKVPQNDKALKAAMQHFTSKGDFPANINEVIEKIHATPDWDNGYEQVFDIRDFYSTNASGFDILDVTSGLTFAKVPLGDKIKIYKMSGAKASVSFDMYGGGLNWLRQWFDDQQWWNIEDTAIAFRNKAYASRAANFYALLEAVTTEDLAWQGITANDQVTRDIATINKAALDIITDCKDKGYGISANTPLVILAPLALMGRINKALAYLNQAVAGSGKSVSYNLKPIYTTMLTTSTKYCVALPGKKLKGGYRMDLTLFNIFDPLAYADTVAGWMRYGGAIGDTDQVKWCATA